MTKFVHVLAAARGEPTKRTRCQWCGAAMASARTTKQYCRPLCRLQAHRAERRQPKLEKLVLVPMADRTLTERVREQMRVNRRDERRAARAH